MLVQPALTTHLLCRPVSIADSTGLCQKIQVLCEVSAVCYRCCLAFLKPCGRNRNCFSTIPSSTLPQALRPADRAGWLRERGPPAHWRLRPGQVHRPDSMQPAPPPAANPLCAPARLRHASSHPRAPPSRGCAPCPVRKDDLLDPKCPR